MKTTFFRSMRTLTAMVAISAMYASAIGEDSSKKRDATFRIVGYLPDYRADTIDSSVGRYLTDLVFFSVVPEPKGQFVSKVLDSPKTVALLKQFREQHYVRVFLCVGGWDRSTGFAEIASTHAARREFAEGLTAYCLRHEFAGADIDWEHPKNEIEAKNYGILLSETAKSFKPHGLRLTVAMAAWQTMTPEGIEAVDAIHLMSYDAQGKHSTLEAARTDVRTLLDAGVPPKKIWVGLPFYGRGVTQRTLVKTYAEIVRDEPKSADNDEIGDLYFNGPSTIGAKTLFAVQQMLGGVMIWEIGQDATGDTSLLKAIDNAVK